MGNSTPGPSALGRNVNAQGAGSHGGFVQGRSNVTKKKEDKDRERQKALKRPSSEEVLGEEERERKKSRFVEDFDDNDGTNPRDIKEKKRKRRRKRKKPISVVVAGSSETSQRSEHEVMGSSLHSSSETLFNGSHGQVAARSLAVGVDKVNGVKVEDDPDDKAPTYSSSDKGKGKAKLDSPKSPTREISNLDNHNLGSGSNTGSDTRSTTLEGLDQSSEIARLTEQLAEQRKLLEKHQTHLNQQQQALTCQICLELLHKPYALIPCGHVTCYGCLIRWFTSDLNAEESIPDEEQQPVTESDHSDGNDLNAILNSAAARRGTFVRRRKSCPVCRGVVHDRPVEMWDIKQMVAALVKSHLVDLPLPPGGEEGEESNSGRERRGNDTPNDPWRNMFRPGGLGRGHHRHGGPPPPGHEDDEDEMQRFGLYDHEDGGVYRCVDCQHELWGGMCTGCERIYRGHEAEEEEEEEEDFFLYDDDDEMDPVQWAGYMFLQDEFRRRFDEVYDDEEESDEEDEEGGLDVADEYNGEYLQDALLRVDEVERAWSVDTDGEGDIDVESSDGFIDEEERTRSGGLSGVGVVDSGEEASGAESVRWNRRYLHARNFFEEEGTSLDEGSDVGIDYRIGWDGGAVDMEEEIRRSLGLQSTRRTRHVVEPGASSDGGTVDTDEGIRRSPTPGLRRSTRRRTQPVVESGASSSEDESECRSPPIRRRSPLRRRVVVDDSENELSSDDDCGW